MTKLTKLKNVQIKIPTNFTSSNGFNELLGVKKD